MSTVPVTDVTARYHGGDVFSTAAHEATPERRRERERDRIERAIREGGAATCDQLERDLGLSHQSCSARISELRRAGRLVEVGRGITVSGRSARIHDVVRDGSGTAP